MSKLPTKISQKMKDKFAITGETFVRNKVANKKRKVEIEIGDSKEPSKFIPQFKTKHWDNEANLSIRLVDDDIENGVVDTKNEKVEWKRAGRTARFYEKETVDEDGGFEFEVELDAKPESNVIKFSVQSKGFDFFYQPELTDEQVLPQWEARQKSKKKRKATKADLYALKREARPENVVGSYAVYHETNRNNIVGGKEYKSGKAFHIYRPWAEDASGVRVWCKLNVDKQAGGMTVTVPQQFLNTAQYPVIVDPTFGYTSVGASNEGGYFTRRKGSLFNLPVAATATSISYYGYISSGGGLWSIKIVNHPAHTQVPNAIVSSSEETSTDAWRTYNFASAAVLPAGDYDLMLNVNQAAISDKMYYDTGSVGQGSQGFSGGSDWHNVDSMFSIYATYTASPIVTVDSLTKSVEFSIETTDSLTKSLAHEIQNNDSLTKATQYEIETTDSVTKPLSYDIKTDTSITKDASYEIVTVDSIQKSSSYEIGTAKPIQKSNTYQVTANSAVTKSAQYSVKTKKPPHLKDVEYSLKKSDALTKSNSYEIQKTGSISKASDYRIKVKVDTLTKPVQHVIESNRSVSKSLYYKIASQVDTLQVETLPATNITSRSATLNGQITEIGDSTVTERGFELSLTTFT